MACIMAASLFMSGGIYNDDGTMMKIFLAYPTFPFCRVVFMLSDNCAWRTCTMFYKDMPEEVWTCIKWLYADAFMYMILAAYLNEVIPQEFGVPRHPLFFLETRIKSWSPSLHDAIFGDE